MSGGKSWERDPQGGGGVGRPAIRRRSRKIFGFPLCVCVSLFASPVADPAPALRLSLPWNPAPPRPALVCSVLVLVLVSPSLLWRSIPSRCKSRVEGIGGLRGGVEWRDEVWEAVADAVGADAGGVPGQVLVLQAAEEGD